jgi:hypothetical protein
MIGVLHMTSAPSLIVCVFNATAGQSIKAKTLVNDANNRRGTMRSGTGKI